MIRQIEELNFPSYATMSAATVTMPDMGDWAITSTIKIDGDITPDFSEDWEVRFRGHRYIMPKRKPAGKKEETSLNATVDLTFQHWAQYQLKRWYFFTIQPNEAGTVVADKYEASVSLNLGDFCELYGQVLKYYFGDRITIDLNTDWDYKAEPTQIEISYTYLWDLLGKLYELFAVRWQIDVVSEQEGANSEQGESYVIKVGYPTTEQTHVFEYGFEGGLLKAERQVQSDEIRNMILGRGGEKNLPYRYFKDTDPENETFAADPDWVEELKDVYFANLMPATFRSYVQGWKAQHIEDYPDYTAVGEGNAYAPWAYRKGYTDEKFDPVEYVADEITINPQTGDKTVVISPTYAPYVTKDSSIAKYGPLMGGLSNNADIYPSIQGVTVEPYGRIDEVVEVEPVTEDETEDDTNEARIWTLAKPWPEGEARLDANGRQTLEISGSEIIVPEGLTGDLYEGDLSVRLTQISTRTTYRMVWDNKNQKWVLAATSGEMGEDFDSGCLEIEDIKVRVYDTANKEYSGAGLPTGAYRFDIEVKVHNTSSETINAHLVFENPRLILSNATEVKGNLWRIWVKNLWGTSKGADETDEEYAERVWRPILGDHVGNEAKVAFATGLLAHEDYEFVIASIPKYAHKKCTWQTTENGQVKTHEYWSEWCIELGKSDAELDTLGFYLPYSQRQAKAGDFFILLGIDMPHRYTVWGEERVDNWKKDTLEEKREIKPTWVVTTDRVRMNGEGAEDALINQLHPGDSVLLADKRFIEGSTETMYLSSLTYTFREPTSEDNALNPDLEIVLSDSYEVSANPVETLSGEVTALAKQVGSIGNISQLVRKIGDSTWLSKRHSDWTPYKLGAGSFKTNNFVEGLYGGVGAGVDERGNAEVESLIVRTALTVMELVINRQSVMGGDSIFTEGGTVESAEYLSTNEDGEQIWKLTLKEDYEGQVQEIQPGMVVRGLMNNLLDAAVSGVSAKYYTSWMRVNSADEGTEGNILNVTLYPGNQVPSGTNYPPCALMKLARWGHQTQEALQRFFLIDSHAGRFERYEGVTQPLTSEGNIAMLIGRATNWLSVLSKGSVAVGEEVGYFKKLIVEGIVQVDYQGNLIPEIIDTGNYDATHTYRHEAWIDNGTRYVTEDCWYRGCRWRCTTDNTQGVAPGYNKTAWAFVSGNPDFTVGFDESQIFYDRTTLDTFNAQLTLWAQYHNQSVRDLLTPSNIAWSRVSYNQQGERRTEADNAWHPTTPTQYGKKRLILTAKDLDNGAEDISRIEFKVTVTGIGAAPSVLQASAKTEAVCVPQGEQGEPGTDATTWSIDVLPGAWSLNEDGEAPSDVQPTVTVWRTTGAKREDMTHLVSRSSTGQITISPVRLYMKVEDGESKLTLPTNHQIDPNGAQAGKGHTMIVLELRRYENVLDTGNYTVLARFTCAIARDGERGLPGKTPAPERIREWKTGSEADTGLYYAGDTGATPTPEPFTDIVYTLDAQTGEPAYWLCIKTFTRTSGQANQTPGQVMSGTKHCFIAAGQFQLLATRLLLAQRARIGLMNTNGIDLYSGSSNLCGQLTGADKAEGVMSWLGGTLTNPMWAVTGKGKQYLGGMSGQHIEFDPASKTMQIFDAEGKCIATHSGQTIKLENATPPTAGTDTVKNASVNLSETSFASSSTESTPVVHTTYKTISGISSTANSTVEVGIPKLSITLRAQETVSRIVADVYLEFLNGSTIVQTTYIGSADTVDLSGEYTPGSSSITKEINARTVTYSGLVTSVRLRYSYYAYSRPNAKNCYISVSATAWMTATSKTAYYKCEYGANGWAISYDNKNYAYLLVINGKLKCKIVSEGKTIVGGTGTAAIL